MIKKFLCIIILFFTTIQATYHQVLPPKPMVVVEIPIDTTYPEVKALLDRVPKEQQADFVEVLKCFADERGFDWRFCLLLMWGESGINTKTLSGGFVGLIQFGYHARIILNLSVEELLQKNFVEQAKFAVIIWEETERVLKTKIKDFQSLQIATFMPAWMNHHGNPYPASDIVKTQNYPLCDANGQMTKESILNIYRKKTHLYEELKYFRNKF
jgi:hypothetical protein